MVGILSAGAGVVVGVVVGSGSDAGQRPALPEETASLRVAQRRGSPLLQSLVMPAVLSGLPDGLLRYARKDSVLSLRGAFYSQDCLQESAWPSSKVRAYVRLATKLPFTGNTIAITVHFGVRAITQKIYGFFVRAHLRAMLPTITAKG